MDKKDEKKGKKCFIITPIGNENTDVFSLQIKSQG